MPPKGLLFMVFYHIRARGCSKLVVNSAGRRKFLNFLVLFSAVFNQKPWFVKAFPRKLRWCHGRQKVPCAYKILTFVRDGKPVHYVLGVLYHALPIIATCRGRQHVGSWLVSTPFFHHNFKIFFLELHLINHHCNRLTQISGALRFGKHIVNLR